jgi:phosphoribosylanthranilate isomerase
MVQKMRVKVCGITNTDDAAICTELGADALGFIFYPRSKRYIEPAKAKEIIQKLPLFINKVGVFVNADLQYVNDIAADTGLTAVQLHGEEDSKYAEEIKLPVIKSFRVNRDFDFNLLKQFNKAVILLDTLSNSAYGGTGEVFHWEIIPEYIRKSIILAGGISTENIEKVYSEINPQAVDLSSSLEEKPGKKDHNKVRNFFNELIKMRNKYARFNES